MSGQPKEVFLSVLAESPVYIAAGVIAALVGKYMPLRLGHESVTTFFVIGLGLGGTWCGKFAWTKAWVFIAAVLFCLTLGAYIYTLKDPNPGEIKLYAEKLALGGASFFFFWIARSAGTGLARSSGNDVDASVSQKASTAP